MTYGKKFAALADGTRRTIFEILRGGEKPVGEIASRLPVSRPAVSQHLKVLLEAGLVELRPEGTRHLYRIRRKGLEEMGSYLDRFWTDVLGAFKEAAEKRGEDDA